MAQANSNLHSGLLGFAPAMVYHSRKMPSALTPTQSIDLEPKRGNAGQGALLLPAASWAEVAGLFFKMELSCPRYRV